MHIILKDQMPYSDSTAPNVEHARETLIWIRACLGDMKIHTACGYWIPTASEQSIQNILCTSKCTTAPGSAAHRLEQDQWVLDQ